MQLNFERGSKKAKLVNTASSKGHLISKCLYGVSNSQKINLKTYIFALAYWGGNFWSFFGDKTDALAIWVQLYKKKKNVVDLYKLSTFQ